MHAGVHSAPEPEKKQASEDINIQKFCTLACQARSSTSNSVGSVDVDMCVWPCWSWYWVRNSVVKIGGYWEG